MTRCKAEYKNEFETAMKEINPVAYYRIIKRAHTFRGKAASTEEVTKAINLDTAFPYTSPDKLLLPVFKNKWDDLFDDKRLTNLGITIQQMPEKTRMYSFANALRIYPHSELVRHTCVVKIAELDEENQDLISTNSMEGWCYLIALTLSPISWRILRFPRSVRK